MGVSGVTLPRDEIQEKPTYQEALTAFEQLPPVRAMFALEPVLSLRKRDVKPLPRKRFAKVTVPLYYQGLRRDAAKGHRRSRSRTRASGRRGSCCRSCRLEVPTGLPPCPGLQGEPCRDYVPIVNRKG